MTFGSDLTPEVVWQRALSKFSEYRVNSGAGCSAAVVRAPLRGGAHGVQPSARSRFGGKGTRSWLLLGGLLASGVLDDKAEDTVNETELNVEGAADVRV